MSWGFSFTITFLFRSNVTILHNKQPIAVACLIDEHGKLVCYVVMAGALLSPPCIVIGMYSKVKFIKHLLATKELDIDLPEPVACVGTDEPKTLFWQLEVCTWQPHTVRFN